MYLTERVSEQTLRNFFKKYVCPYFSKEKGITEYQIQHQFNLIFDKSDIISIDQLFYTFFNERELRKDPKLGNKIDLFFIVESLYNTTSVLDILKEEVNQLKSDLTKSNTIKVTKFWKSFIDNIFDYGKVSINSSTSSVTFDKSSTKVFFDMLDNFVDVFSKVKALKTNVFHLSATDSMMNYKIVDPKVTDKQIDEAIEKIKQVYSSYDGKLFSSGKDFSVLEIKADITSQKSNSEINKEIVTLLSQLEKQTDEYFKLISVDLSSPLNLTSKFTYFYKNKQGKIKKQINDFNVFLLTISQINADKVSETTYQLLQQLVKKLELIKPTIQYKIIVSRDITAMLEMSTSRPEIGGGWKSCMRVDDKEPWGYESGNITHNLMEGSLIGYVVPLNEPESAIPEKPVGRILIHPYYKGQNKILIDSNTWYSNISSLKRELAPLVQHTVNTWLHTNFNKAVLDKSNETGSEYTISKNVYPDLGIRTSYKNELRETMDFRTFLKLK